jgi:protein-tyrosine phosphatase
MVDASMSKRCALGVVLAVLVFSTGCRSLARFSCPSAEAVKPRNFGEIVDNDGAFAGVYRGAQLHSCNELAYLKTLGVKTIVKLNDGGGPLDRAEEREAEAAGIAVKAFDFSAWSIGQPDNCEYVRRVIRFIQDEANRPVYIHCTAGRDRTGYIVGTYEEAVLRKPVSEVLAELAKFGHHGYPTLLFPQIRRELRSGKPHCIDASP